MSDNGLPVTPSPPPARDPAAAEHSLFGPVDTFVHRHVGPSDADTSTMLAELGLDSLDALIDETVPASIRQRQPLELDDVDQSRLLGEVECLERLRAIARRNQVFRSYIGMGYYDCLVPAVIQRNILENPGWYTQYTPYQAEISQGRLEALLNFQTMVSDLTALPVANASLLDEATAAAEAMVMAHRVGRGKKNTFFASADCHPQTLAVLETRAQGPEIELVVGDPEELDFSAADMAKDLFGVLLQYPTSDGRILDHRSFIERAHGAKAMVIMATDLLALTLLEPPGELGADVAVGSAQRFGVPLGFGGPHAAFLSTLDKHKRRLPGRVIGVSRDSRGKDAYRMAMQTREQHIRREKATSNICTSQVLLAVMAGMYAVYHGPEGLRRIAGRVHSLTLILGRGLERLGFRLGEDPVFDTLRVEIGSRDVGEALAAAEEQYVNLRRLGENAVGISLDEATSVRDVETLLEIFARLGGAVSVTAVGELADGLEVELPAKHRRTSDFLTHPVFHRYRTEHEMLRYLHRLERKDLSLTTSMISLGSCTMKLNGTTEMMPITWPEFSHLHPFAPESQFEGYSLLFRSLESWLCSITGFTAVSLQPNAGSQGEYAGLMVIRQYHLSRGHEHRDVCLVPISAHGTNPASSIMAGMRVVVVACDEHGNIDVEDLKAKAEKHRDRLAALMVTYPSTHGVFEEAIREVCEIVHRNDGQVYFDGANLNAQVGLCRPADYGADVCHLNLHKTFAIPHGGGGPGVGPIGVRDHLAPFLPDHPVVSPLASSEQGIDGEQSMGAVAAAPWGSAGILSISWVYIALMGPRGLKKASEVAILNANYMAKRLEKHYPVLYRGAGGRVAHEFIADIRPFEKNAGVSAEDVAKRLMDYGFHAPTMSFPVPGTLMIEPTESESKAELDRFCEAMIQIREEIRAVEEGRFEVEDNPLHNAPHTADMVTATEWNHPYSREQAAFPAPWVSESKFWPTVGRIDNAWGDRHLVCSCPPIESYQDS